jgi:hypothetical protein
MLSRTAGLPSGVGVGEGAGVGVGAAATAGVDCVGESPPHELSDNPAQPRIRAKTQRFMGVPPVGEKRSLAKKSQRRALAGA